MEDQKRVEKCIEEALVEAVKKCKAAGFAKEDALYAIRLRDAIMDAVLNFLRDHNVTTNGVHREATLMALDLVKDYLLKGEERGILQSYSRDEFN